MTMTRRWAIGTAIAAVVILAAGWFLLVKPQKAKVSDLHTQTASQEQQNQLLLTQISALQAEQKELPKQQQILQKFARKNGVALRNYAVHLNHLHLHVQFPSRIAYLRFVRAISAAIAMAVAGMNRWTQTRIKFWDRRPFSRPVLDRRAEQRVDDYIEVNKLEAIGYERISARFKVAFAKPRYG